MTREHAVPRVEPAVAHEVLRAGIVSVEPASPPRGPDASRRRPRHDRWEWLGTGAAEQLGASLLMAGAGYVQHSPWAIAFGLLFAPLARLTVAAGVAVRRRGVAHARAMIAWAASAAVGFVMIGGAGTASQGELFGAVGDRTTVPLLPIAGLAALCTAAATLLLKRGQTGRALLVLAGGTVGGPHALVQAGAALAQGRITDSFAWVARGALVTALCFGVAWWVWGDGPLVDPADEPIEYP